MRCGGLSAASAGEGGVGVSRKGGVDFGGWGKGCSSGDSKGGCCGDG